MHIRTSSVKLIMAGQLQTVVRPQADNSKSMYGNLHPNTTNNHTV